MNSLIQNISSNYSIDEILSIAKIVAYNVNGAESEDLKKLILTLIDHIETAPTLLSNSESFDAGVCAVQDDIANTLDSNLSYDEKNIIKNPEGATDEEIKNVLASVSLMVQELYNVQDKLYDSNDINNE